ncbi:septal ring lytic transglycosylase RlpA family protein [Phormidium sp. LEGE 05292]|uniref:septal ring lytic transglycosylase RlpA family protein n=1 Tax=[Phormidium] sp. LEGE 05292 TaxID=767427 RepID=UPI00187EB9B4|nr:septal ring lytic transglycosylase RlpA family protein [Phormidium sp. LEGE 05292]MBE9229996.1 septal ring lytic transglycosylase RlpA family protein [Phormidium sp. LEGE 05292]
MKQRFWSSISAAILTTALGTTLSCHAETNKVKGKESEIKPAPAASQPLPPASTQTDTIKVGEYQSKTGGNAQEQVIAKIQTHEVAGRQIAILYLRDIPVLTFVGSSPVESSNVKEGTLSQNGSQQVENTATNPIARATAVAAKLNQLNRENLDANNITVAYSVSNKVSSTSEEILQAQAHIASNQKTAILAKNNRNTSNGTLRDRYIIKVNNELLVEITDQTRLPDTTNNLAEDALQATNRLRRLMGNAPPLTDIPGRPTAQPQPAQVAFAPIPTVKAVLSGLASWYGPGFHGNRSASGERYNQNALTAAHRSLPFGTMVRVTNLRNGLSVVVRINDRGPFARGRIIDLSAASARIIGLTSSGVAQVKLEVLGEPRIITTDAPVSSIN